MISNWGCAIDGETRARSVSIYFGMSWKPSHFPPCHDFSAVFINFLNPLNIKLHAWKFDKTILLLVKLNIQATREIRFRVISSLNSGFLNSLPLDAGLFVLLSLTSESAVKRSSHDNLLAKFHILDAAHLTRSWSDYLRKLRKAA